MVTYTATIKKFATQGEKTGWTYIEVPEKIANKLLPDTKKSFRVKGKLDNFEIKGVSLLPMGGGSFIMALNATIRKGIKKSSGATVAVSLTVDEKGYTLPKDFTDCLADEPAALKHFNSLAGSHRNYFGKWIDSARTDVTKAKRIAMAVNALAKKMGYPEMMRSAKAEKEMMGR